MRLFVVGVVCALIACTQKLPFGCEHESPGRKFVDDGGLGIDGAAGRQIVFVGQKVTLMSAVAESGDRCGNVATVTGARSSVVGPDNLPVESTQGPVMSSDSHYVTTVTFTPTVVGSFHVETTFEPSLGIGQLDVVAAIDGMNAPVQTTYAPTTTQSCLTFQVTDFGTLLCGGYDIETHAYRVQEQVDSKPGNVVAVDGSSIWIGGWSSSILRHFIDTGTGPLIPGDPASVSIDGFMTALVPGQSSVLVAFDDHVTLFAATDAGIETTQWLGGGGLTTAARNGSSIVAGASGGVFANLDGGTQLDIVPGSEGMLAVGYRADELWMTDASLRVTRFVPGLPVQLTTLTSVIGWGVAGGQLTYGVAPLVLAGGGEALTVSSDPASHALNLSAWGTSTNVFFVINDTWLVEQSGYDKAITVRRVLAP